MSEKSNNKNRLFSLDALRGFDMFWIIGGDKFFIALGAFTGWPFLQWWATQLEHASWHGFTFYDMIFPLFLFIAGVSFPFSFAKRYQGAENRKAVYLHIFKRATLLVILGIIYNNAIRFDFSNLRYGSVLGHIGLAWMFAALIFVNSKLIFRIIWFFLILLAYWLLLVLFPAGDLGSNDPFSMEGSLTGFIDRKLMPGILYCKIHDPEGLLSVLPAIATALLGMFTGEFLMSKSANSNRVKQVILMALVAIALIAIGKIWDIVFPINKNLWTSSFVCFAGGLSLLLFTIFYLIIDVLNFKSWSKFFVVIGLNSITIYLALALIDFYFTNNFLFGGFISLFPENWSSLLSSATFIFLVWLSLFFLYKKKIFLKV